MPGYCAVSTPWVVAQRPRIETDLLSCRIRVAARCIVACASSSGPVPHQGTRSLGQVLLASHDRGFVAFAFAAVQGDAVAASKLSHKSKRHTWHHGEFTRTSSPYHVVGRIMSHHGSCGGFVLECVSVCVSVLCMFSSVLPGLLAHRVGPRRSHHHTHELRYCNIISVISRTTIPYLIRYAI